MADQVLQEIKDRLNIADVIAGYIPIKKSGVNFKAACPFHHEKSPSLVISPSKQIWHCFGCGEGGDVFGFVKRYENLDFKETLKILSDKAGVKLPAYSQESKKVEDEKDILLRINNFAARYYHQVLMSQKGSNALLYLKSRGLNEHTIKHWQIGFAPEDFHALERALAQKGINPTQMVRAGVSSKNERGQMYDRFRGRITFPIFNYFGDTVGFSARILKDDGKSAKYINSPETAIYNKSKTLFGLNFAKEAIRKKDEMVLVEGQMDCISLHQSGFSNVVASSGTAYNESAIDFTTARRLSNNVKLCFDSDTAGQIALRKTGELLLKQGFKVKVILLKTAKDPDELVKKSPGLWEKATSEAERFLDYFINLAEIKYAQDKVEQLNYLSEQVLPLLVFIEDPLEQGHYVQKIVKQYSVLEKDIREKLKNIKKPQRKLSEPDIIKVSGSLLLQKEVLGGLLFLSEFASKVRQQIDKSDFEDKNIAFLIDLWLNSPSNSPQILSDPLAKEALFMVESQLEELNGDKEKLKASLDKSFILLKLHSLKLQQQELQTQIKLAEATGEKAKLEILNKKFAETISLRSKLEKNK